jgi:hypothetical protein
MRLKRIEPVSLGKILGLMYVVLGFIVGFFVSAICIIGTLVGMPGRGDSPFPHILGLFFGIGSVILFPFLYGVLGFVGGIIAGWFYNIIAKWTGGIEMEFDGGFTQSVTISKSEITQ